LPKIEYFVCDLDGCISEPFSPPDWQLLTQLRELSDASQYDASIPKLTICTGRPAAYTEAIALWLNVQAPVLFESGVGLLDLPTQAITFNPALPQEAEQISRDIHAYFKTLQLKHPDINPECKMIDNGLTCANINTIEYLLPIVKDTIAQHYPMLEVHHTDISINVLWPQANKGSGLRWLCKLLDLNPKQIAYIGDTSGDVPALEVAGLGFAPNNAKDCAKQAANIVTVNNSTKGVIEAWEYLIKHNRQ